MEKNQLRPALAAFLLMMTISLLSTALSFFGSPVCADLGFVMAGSGIGGVVWSNLFSKLLGELGWRFGYRVLGTCWAALALLALVILGKRDLTGGIGHAHAAGEGNSKQEALRSSKFFMAAFIMCAITVASCISQQLPAVLGGLGRGEGEISLMLSVMTAFVAVGSVAEGVLCSRFGIVRTLGVVLGLYALGFSLLALGTGVYPALVCLALGGSALGTLMPVVVRQLFGGRDYAAIWSVVISCSSVASFLSTPGWGMVYDTFGTYTPAPIAMPVIQLAAIAALLAAFRGKK